MSRALLLDVAGLALVVAGLGHLALWAALITAGVACLLLSWRYGQ